MEHTVELKPGRSLRVVSEQIASFWTSVAYELDLDETSVTLIDADHITYSGLQKKAEAMLIKVRNKQGKIMLSDVTGALEKLDKLHDANQIRSKLLPTGGEIPV